MVHAAVDEPQDVWPVATFTPAGGLLMNAPCICAGSKRRDFNAASNSVP